MTYQIISVLCGGPGPQIPGLDDLAYQPIDNRDNALSPCAAMYKGAIGNQSDVLIYCHDDLAIHDPYWLKRVLRLFSKPEVAVVGLGGAKSLGHPDLYKRAYRLSDMARGGYRSNQTDWQMHGGHEEWTCQVAVVDAFFMAVRRTWLESVGGWPVDHLTHHVIDLWAACEAARTGMETWVIGANCTHFGGGSSIGDKYKEAKWLQGGSLRSDHELPHVWLYETYRQWLPIRVK
jgi:hypothetical protein